MFGAAPRTGGMTWGCLEPFSGNPSDSFWFTLWKIFHWSSLVTTLSDDDKPWWSHGTLWSSTVSHFVTARGRLYRVSRTGEEHTQLLVPKSWMNLPGGSLIPYGWPHWIWCRSTFCPILMAVGCTSVVCVQLRMPASKSWSVPILWTSMGHFTREHCFVWVLVVVDSGEEATIMAQVLTTLPGQSLCAVL